MAIAGGGAVRFGTASWTDPTMTAPGVFYPRGGSSAAARLAYYSSRFALVEVDATYYALPSATNADLWVARTPSGFVFDVKAHAVMTGHPTELQRLPVHLRTTLSPSLRSRRRVLARDLPEPLVDGIWHAFADGIAPLHAAGKLGAVLLQYPPWFGPDAVNRSLVLSARDRLSPMRCAVEFRHAGWFADGEWTRTLSWLRGADIPFVMVDGPQGMASSVPPVIAVPSATLAVIRFHGRRTSTWERSGAGAQERFRYFYDRAELQEWVARIREVAALARETHVVMNNCHANYGSTNAAELAALVRTL